MLPDDHPGRIQIAFDDHRLVANAGLILPATLGQHLGLPELVDRHLDLGSRPRPSQHRRQGADAGGDCAGWRRLHRRRRRVAHRQDGPGSGLCGQGAIHPGDVPAQLQLGPRPSAGSGEPRVTGQGLGCWSGTGRRAIHHRPGLHHLRDLRISTPPLPAPENRRAPTPDPTNTLSQPGFKVKR